MASREYLRLVSLDDGGGARSFSQLRIMGQIMYQLSYERFPEESDRIMLPCEHFDLLGGSGTGGLIAIMFARLRMSVEEVSDEFFTIVEEVYKPRNLSPSERTQKLKECMENIMERKGLPINSKFIEKSNRGHCASFVLASPRTNAASKVCLRSYSARSHLPSTITVIEAALATCAVPPRFSSVTSGSGYNKKEYIGASFGSTNPVREVITEAHSLFGGDSGISSLLSLGTGHPGVISFPSGGGADLHSMMRDMMNDCEQRAQEIEQQIGRVGIYFRFSVEQGMQSDHLGPVADPSQVVAQTECYITEHRTNEKICEFIQNFDTATRLITLDQLKHSGGAGVHIPAGVTLEALLIAAESRHEDAILAKLKVGDLECGPHIAECMEGTRRDILERINTWMVDFDSPNILWLKGHPGVGKSAIASSLVEQLGAAKRLGSRFFFQRQRAVVMTTQALWRTVAYDLARQYPAIRKHLLAALQAEETIPTTVNVDKLFRQVIQEPILASKEITTERLPVVIIDALDECGGLDGQHSEVRRSLMRTLESWSSLPAQFKLIVTSRSESDIARAFLRTKHHPIEISAGQTVQAQSSKDIRTFFTRQLQQRVVYQYEDSLSPDWPGPQIIEDLADKAAGLFIWAQTVVNFISFGEPQQRLNLVLKGGGTGDVKSLYEQILSTSFPHPHEEEISNFRSVAGTIILAKEPLSFLSLRQLLSLEASTVKHICNGLQSVLDSKDTLQFHHQSFVDFLIDPHQCPQMFVVKQGQETRNLALSCLRVMKNHLKFNICDLKSSYLRNDDVLGLALGVTERIPSHVSYSSYFWANHLAEITFDLEIFRALHFFMDNQFLFWLEILSLTKRVNLASSMLSLLIAWIPTHSQDDAMKMATDMLKFVAVFANVISQSMAHIYLTAVPFSPRNSAVSKQYRKQFPRTAAIQTGGLSSWPALQNILSDHQGAVESVAFSPDGKRIVSGSHDKMIRVWDAETGEVVVGPLKGHSGWVHSVAFSPDGKRIASGSRDKTVCVWDAETGEAVVGPLEGHSEEVNSVAFSPDGKRIASGSDDHTVLVWNAGTGEVAKGPLEGHSGEINTVAFSPDGKCIVSGSRDRTIRVWDAETGEVVAGPFTGHCARIAAVAYSPDGKHIISGSHDMTIRMWDAKTGEVIARPFEGHTAWVKSVAFSSDGKRIASGSNDQTVRVWDAETGQVVAGPLEGHGRIVWSVAFSQDGKRIVSGSYDKTIRVWDAETGEAVTGPFEGHSSVVYSVAFSPDGKRLVSGSEDKTIRIWDAETGEGVAGPFYGHNNNTISVSFSPDGTRIVSGSHDKTIRVWDAKTGEVVTGPLKGHSDCVYSVAFSPDGKRLVSGSRDKTVWVWDAETGGVVAGPLKGHSDWVRSVAFSPDGKRIVSGSRDKTICVWDAEVGEVIVGPLEGHSGEINSVAFSPDGKRIASGSNDHTVRVWDAGTGKVAMGALKGHSDWIQSVAFSPDGKRIVSGSRDNTIRVWDAETGQVVAGPLEGHSSIVWSVAFSPDGKWVVSGSADKTIRVWDVMIRDSESGKDISRSFTDSSVMRDGWVLGPNSELLFWIPPTLREGLFWPNSKLIIGNFIKTKLNLKLFVHGKSWSNCTAYTGI